MDWADRFEDPSVLYTNRTADEKPAEKPADVKSDFEKYLEKSGLGDEVSVELRERPWQTGLYYLHGDHLGTATFVTNSQSEATQYFLNLPFGETMYEKMDGSYDNPYKFNAKELDEDTGLYYYGARYYNPRLSIWYGVDPLTEKMPSWSPYNYTFDNPVRYIDPDGRKPFDWLLITGDKIYWYGGKYGDKSNLKQTFKASSGMNNVKLTNGKIKNLQQAKYQYVASNGPTVEGKYKVNLEADPDRVAKADGKTGELMRNPDGGIEKIPDFVPSDKNPKVGWSYEDWGKNRARLEPVNVPTPTDNSKETGIGGGKRDLQSFYLHDSEKGYSHGCIECESGLFDELKNYRDKGNNMIEVQVKYPSKEHVTNGGTKKQN
jgi:RHS repeat-associated protein